VWGGNLGKCTYVCMHVKCLTHLGMQHCGSAAIVALSWCTKVIVGFGWLLCENKLSSLGGLERVSCILWHCTGIPGCLYHQVTSSIDLSLPQKSAHSSCVGGQCKIIFIVCLCRVQVSKFMSAIYCISIGFSPSRA